MSASSVRNRGRRAIKIVAGILIGAIGIVVLLAFLVIRGWQLLNEGFESLTTDSEQEATHLIPDQLARIERLRKQLHPNDLSDLSQIREAAEGLVTLTDVNGNDKWDLRGTGAMGTARNIHDRIMDEEVALTVKLEKSEHEIERLRQLTQTRGKISELMAAIRTWDVLERFDMTPSGTPHEQPAPSSNQPGFSSGG